MSKLVKQNLKRIATELQSRFDYSEVDDLLLDIEEIETTLTPPNKELLKADIIKEFLKVYDTRDDGKEYTYKETVAMYDKIIEDNHKFFELEVEDE